MLMSSDLVAFILARLCLPMGSILFKEIETHVNAVFVIYEIGITKLPRKIHVNVLIGICKTGIVVLTCKKKERLHRLACYSGIKL